MLCDNARGDALSLRFGSVAGGLLGAVHHPGAETLYTAAHHVYASRI